MRTIALALLLTLGTAGPAAAADHDDGPGTGGFMSPHLENSPVNVIICSTADACVWQGKPR